MGFGWMKRSRLNSSTTLIFSCSTHPHGQTEASLYWPRILPPKQRGLEHFKTPFEATRAHGWQRGFCTMTHLAHTARQRRRRRNIQWNIQWYNHCITRLFHNFILCVSCFIVFFRFRFVFCGKNSTVLGRLF